MQRRKFTKLSLSGLALWAFGFFFKASKAFAASAVEKLSIRNTEWKKKLTPQQYNILREEGTERAFTSELLDEHREGFFACVACDLPLFTSAAKFDSGTGWPSFYQALEGHIETKADYKLLLPRTEYHCARCRGHHGHVFEDGPKPTGLRFCNNGAALKFISKEV